MRSAALSHVRVLDLSRVLAGPWASQVLADLGAEVIKVERPGAGDETRGWGPPWLEGDGTASARPRTSPATNRGKRSVTVDISRARGAGHRPPPRRPGRHPPRELQGRRARALRPRLRDLAAVNPRLVYCSISGFGQDGPYRDRPGYDFLVQAMGGLMSVTGEPDGVPGGGPVKVGVALTDLLTGMYAATAVLAALAHRDRTGEGQHVDLSLLDVQVATLANQAESYLVTGVPPPRLGNAHPSIVPYQAFATADGHLVLAVGNDAQFARFCEVAGPPGPGARSEVRNERGAGAVARGARADPRRAPRLPDDRRVGRGARGGGRAVRPDQRPRAGVRRDRR